MAKIVVVAIVVVVAGNAGKRVLPKQRLPLKSKWKLLCPLLRKRWKHPALSLLLLRYLRLAPRKRSAKSLSQCRKASPPRLRQQKRSLRQLFPKLRPWKPKWQKLER